MKTFSHLSGLLYGRPHFITQPALDALDAAFQAHLQFGGQAIVGLAEGVSQAITQLTGFRMDSGDGGGDSEEISYEGERVGPIAIIPLTGVVARHVPTMQRLCFGGCDLDRVDAALLRAAKDPTISAIVLNCNSPGGSATGTPETAALFRAVGEQKTTIAFSDTQCCSAAYYIASQASEVVCSQSAWLGSIGTRAVFQDRSMQLASQGIKTNAIAIGKWKVAGADFKEMTAEERAMFQALCTQLNDAFRATVSAARPQIAPESMEGQCFIGQAAVDSGLADGLADNIDQVVCTILAARTV